MAMIAADLASAITDAISDIDADNRTHANVWGAVATAIITYIKTNAVVSVTVATTGTAAAQTGTGTGTVS